MIDIDATRTEILDFLTSYTSNNNSVVARLRNAVVQNDKTLAIKNSLVSDDEDEDGYGMTLKQFTNLNSYLAVMNSMYGNNSGSKFKAALNNVLNAGKNSQIANAKNFIQKMKENGLNNASAMNAYKALNTYSLVSNMQNDVIGFISAKV